MRIKQHSDPHEYRAAALPHLLRDEALNCVAISIAETLVRSPARWPEFYLWTVEDADGRVVGASWMTPPHPLGLSPMPPEAVALLVEAAGRLPRLPTQVAGPRAEADLFRDLWCAARGGSVRLSVGQRLFQTETATIPFLVPGAMRPAVHSDRDLLVEWSISFCADCKLDTTPEEAERAVDFAIRDQHRYLWEHEGEPVAMAAAVGPTPSGIRIGAVYTPPEWRRRGYATGLVSALTNEMLARGRRWCFLYTDVANPTSNGIYQRIGYRPIAECAHHCFA